MLRVRMLACVGLWSVANWGSHAQADWLIEVSEDLPRHDSSPTELIYPRPGLPALAEPGELIVARVRVPAPLMPAPGIQQPRALRGWSAELIGHSNAADEGAEHRYALRVLDVRANGASGLVFRATVRVPPWAAPGTYTFRIDSPGSVVAAAPGAVRVLVPDRRPVVAQYAEHEAHERWDVDVWLSERSVPSSLAGTGVPWLDTNIDARFAFDVEVGESAPRRVQSHVFLESRERVVVEGATWYPATDVRPAGVRPSILARVEGEPSVRREGTCTALAIEAPSATVVDQVLFVRGEATSVAWAFEEDGAVYSLSTDNSTWTEVGIRLHWLGIQEVHGLAVEDGCARRGETAVRVEPALRMGCSAAQPSGFLWFFGLLCTITARRYKPRRNLLTDVRRPTSQP